MTSDVRNTPGGELNSSYEGSQHKQDAPGGPEFEADNCTSCEAITRWSLTGYDDKDWVKSEEEEIGPENIGSREVLTNVCMHVKAESTTDPMEDISISPPVMADAAEESRAISEQLSPLSSDRSTLMDSSPYPTRVAKRKPAEDSTLQSKTDPRKVLYKCTICQKIFSERFYLIRHQENHALLAAKQREARQALLQSQIFTTQSKAQSHLVQKSQKVTALRKAQFHSQSQSAKLNAQRKAERHFIAQSEIFNAQCKALSHSFSQSQNLTTQSLPDTREKTSKCNGHSESFTQSEHHSTSNQEPLIGGSLWKCPVCREKFTSAALLTIHQLVHSIKTPYSCNICRKLFISFHHLQKHRQSHKGSKQLKSIVHGIGSEAKGKIRKKQCTAKGKKTRLRDLEQQQQPLSMGSLAKGNITQQQGTDMEEMTLSCPSCNKSFKTRGLLRDHTCNLTDWAVNACEICGKQFRDPSYLVSHRRTHTGIKSYKCDVCGRVFTYPGLLIQHQLRHKQVKKFKCKLCGKVFDRPRSLARHKYVHTTEKRLNCNVCGKKYKWPHMLSLHMEVHFAERPFKCNLCDIRFKQADNLRKHKAIHAREKRLNCNVFGKKLKGPHLLSRNMEIHSNKRPFKCDVCDIRFKQADHLRKHNAIHAGEKPYKCPACGEGFFYSANLQTHNCPLPREKPKPYFSYLCHICGKQFTKLQSLDRHMCIHTGKTPHKCIACGKEFRWQCQLSIHKCTDKAGPHSSYAPSNLCINLSEEPSAKISKAGEAITDNINSNSDGSDWSESCIDLSVSFLAGSPIRSLTGVSDVTMITDRPRARASTTNQRAISASHRSTVTASQWATDRVTDMGSNGGYLGATRATADKSNATIVHEAVATDQSDATVAQRFTFVNHNAANYTHSDSANHIAVSANQSADTHKHGADTTNHKVDTANSKALTANKRTTPGDFGTVRSQKQHSQDLEPDNQLIADSGALMSPEGPGAAQPQILSADMRARLVELLQLVPCNELEAILCEAGHSLPRRKEERTRVTRANPALREQLHAVVRQLYASLPQSQAFSLVGKFSDRQQIFITETLTALLISKYGTKKWSMVDIFSSIRRLWENERSKTKQDTVAQRAKIKQKGTPGK